MTDPKAGRAAQGSFRVLVVDDDPDMAGFLVRLLAQQGLDADVESDGQQALKRIAASPPDLVLLDVMMPSVSGFDVCRKLKSNEATALVPVVLVTALEDQDSRVRGIEAGADDFLSKPVRREELIARVNTLRRLHETRKELERRRLAAEVQEKETIRKAFSRYLSPRLAERVLQDKDRSDVFRNLSNRAAVVALFADLRGFTRLSETVPVSSIVPMLNEFFTVLTAAVHEHEGTVFSMAGDSLLVGFNVPVPQADATERAVATARAMLQRFAPVAARWRKEYGLHVGIGVGIEAGEVVVGNVGAPSFMSYTIIGDTVNVAARLMQTALADEILIGPRAALSLGPFLGRATALDRRKVALKGKAAPVEVVSLKVAAA
ncbi:MAG TPA: response regulator [Burkholderiales bacterium]|nr:response regulator [Burkholderiales bacterium]HEX2650913.1 response regulator [Burkholderiales bacterium]